LLLVDFINSYANLLHHEVFNLHARLQLVPALNRLFSWLSICWVVLVPPQTSIDDEMGLVNSVESVSIFLRLNISLTF